MTTRIQPLEPPYGPEEAEILRAMMPAGREPIGLFRLFAKNPAMARAMQPWGGYELSRHLSLSLRQREIVIIRNGARTGCEYEWGIHVATFAKRAELTDAQVTSLTHGHPDDGSWSDAGEQLLIRAVDALVDGNDIPDALWPDLAAHFDESQLLDLLLLTGWYRAITYVARATRLALEPGTPTFESVR